MRDAIAPTSDNRERVAAAVSAYFDFVAGDGQAYRLVFESDLRGEPEAAAVVDGALTRCIDTVAAAVTADAGLDAPPGPAARRRPGGAEPGRPRSTGSTPSRRCRATRPWR